METIVTKNSVIQHRKCSFRKLPWVESTSTIPQMVPKAPSCVDVECLIFVLMSLRLDEMGHSRNALSCGINVQWLSTYANVFFTMHMFDSSVRKTWRRRVTWIASMPIMKKLNYLSGPQNTIWILSGNLISHIQIVVSYYHVNRFNFL